MQKKKPLTCPSIECPILHETLNEEPLFCLQLKGFCTFTDHRECRFIATVPSFDWKLFSLARIQPAVRNYWLPLLLCHYSSLKGYYC